MIVNPEEHEHEHEPVQKIEEREVLDHRIYCSICLDDSHDDSTFKTVCGHVFHVYCLERWCIQSKTCPNCRCKLKEYPQPQPYPTVPTEEQMKARNLLRDYFDSSNPMDNLLIMATTLNYLLISDGIPGLRYTE
jgi:hypothetical protein